jgi:predicted nucleic acid-binding protein
VTNWLVDKSALVRLAASPDAAEWGRADRTRTGTDHHRHPPGNWLFSPARHRVADSAQTTPAIVHAVEYLTPAIEDRAMESLTLLADRGQHRAPSLPDLIIAATAELAGLTVLHLDQDLDLIAEITGQPMERLNIRPPAVMDKDAGRAEA